VLDRGRRAITDADLLVFVVDGREGLVPGDEEIARVLREANRPVLLVINKTDDHRARAGALEFYDLGFEPAFEISAEHGEGVGDLLDAIVERAGRVPQSGPNEDDDVGRVSRNRAGDLDPDAEASIAIIGRPNAGKSSLVNWLLREERMIVSEMPGTTRDAVDTLLTWHRRKFRIVDTAGIRRPGRVASSGQLESVSVLLSRRSIEDADIVVLVIDAAAGATDQDATIAGEADRLGKGVIIAANKWDLMKDRGPDFVKEFDEALHRQLKFLDYAPVLHISARTGERALPGCTRSQSCSCPGDVWNDERGFEHARVRVVHTTERQPRRIGRRPGRGLASRALRTAHRDEVQANAVYWRQCPRASSIAGERLHPLSHRGSALLEDQQQVSLCDPRPQEHDRDRS